MGQLIAKNEDQWLKELNARYKVISQINDARYGQCTLMLGGVAQIVHKEIRMHTEAQFNQWKQRLMIREKMEHNNILSLKAHFASYEHQLCSTYYGVHLVFEYIPGTLNDLMSKPITALEFEKVMKGCIRGFSALQQQKIVNGNIRLLTISYSDDVKVCDSSLLTTQSGFSAVMQDFSGIISGYYLSPILCQAISAQNYTPVHNPYKSDVFSLGMVLLSLIAQRDLDDCYNYEKGSIDHAHIKQLLREHKDANLLESMLAVEENDRPDFVQLLNKIENNKITPPIILDPLPRNSSTSSPSKQQIQITKALMNDQPDIGMQKMIEPNPSSIAHIDILIHSNNDLTRRSINPQLSSFTVQDRAESIYRPFVHDSLQRPINSRQDSLHRPINSRPSNSYNYQSQPQYQHNQYENGFRQTTSHPMRESSHFSNKGRESLSSKDHVRYNSSKLIGKYATKVQFVSEVLPSGEKYIGEKVGLNRHGKGLLYYREGGYYDGQWENNKINGKGILYYASGKPAYEGDWLNDKFHGHGVLYNEFPQVRLVDYFDFNKIGDSWSKYIGGFADDCKQGRGELHFANGDRFEGEFVQDWAHGGGIYFSQTGVHRGKWSHNQLQ